MRRRSITAALAAAATLTAGALTAPAASASPSSTAVPNTKPGWLARAQHLGRAGATSGVDARVYLQPRGGLAALQAQVAAVSTPGNPQYHQFLSASAYQAQYAPTDAAVNGIERWLRSAGMQVTGVGPHNAYVSVAGTVAHAQGAFGTAIGRYRHDGQTVQAPGSAVTVPDAVAPNVLTVTGLDTTVHTAATAAAPALPPPSGFRNAHPCSLSYGQLKAKYQADYQTKLPKFGGTYLPYAVCGYTGPQLRAAYENNTTLDGTGATVAIVDAYASPNIASDASTYAANHGDAAYAPGQLTQHVARPFKHSKACGGSGWWSEETLDVEAVHAMAPGANIRYYGAASCYDTDLADALTAVVTEDQAQIVTNSWGEAEQYETADLIAVYEQIFMQGAMEGISFSFSSGDNGDELANTGLKQADYPASDPYVTAVGGTAAAIDGSGQLAWQTGWGTDRYGLAANGKSWTPTGFMYGSGGGASALFNQPGYQQGTTPGPYRDVPDVAMDADPTTGMLIGITQKFPTGPAYGEYRIGGTSLASPLFAGFTALAIGAQSATSGGTGFGALNPIIYGNPGAFTDITGPGPDAGNVRVDYANGLDSSGGLVYSVRTFNSDSSLSTGPGWDYVTGLGSPNAGWLAALG